jgi:hypothetical protein
VFLVKGASNPFVPLLILGPSFFSGYSFLVHHPFNRHDQHLLAHALAFDFTVAWQFSHKEQLVFSLQISFFVLNEHKVVGFEIGLP